jgi:tetratricopeptide (TPR) repeat protein
LPHHLDVAMVLRNVGLVYQSKGEFQQALLYLKKALTIYRYSLSETHPNIIQIEQIIHRISSKS